MNLFLTCPPGLEPIVRKEISIHGYKPTTSVPWGVFFEGDETAVPTINLRSRVGNKVYIVLGQAKITTFNDLFELVTKANRSDYIAKDHPIIVNAQSNQSQLTSTPTIQSITKKAIVKKLLGGDGELNENSELSPVEIDIKINRDICLVLVNTTWPSLHQRGYRLQTGDAPLKENVAAALVLMAGRKFSKPLYDLFCGSGTIAIEATLIAKNIAPGSFRHFAYEHFARTLHGDDGVRADIHPPVVNTPSRSHVIIASDVDPVMIEIAKKNAQKAGVAEFITFEVKSIDAYKGARNLEGTLVSNPPYGERLKSTNLKELYETINDIYMNNLLLNGGILTSVPFEEIIDLEQWKKTNLYNGGEPVTFWKVARW